MFSSKKSSDDLTYDRRKKAFVPQEDNQKKKQKLIAYIFMSLSLLLGVLLCLLGAYYKDDIFLSTLMSGIGSGFLATALITITLEFFWSRVRERTEQERLDRQSERYIEKFETFSSNIGNQMAGYTSNFEQFSERLLDINKSFATYKDLGLVSCHSDRAKAIKVFFEYAEKAIEQNKRISSTYIYSYVKDLKDKEKEVPDITKQNEREKLIKKPEFIEYVNNNSQEKITMIKIVSSSARGLMGYIDRSNHEFQDKWRKLMVKYPEYFEILLTHPSFAYLRQPSEERGQGDIEIEILKSMIFLVIVARMDHEQVRLYRGSPTVFLIQVDGRILLNPYPYGKMAMDTLSLEFMSTDEDSFASRFAWMHFDHPWKFYRQSSKQINGQELVMGIDNLYDILKAFGDCTYVDNSSLLRLNKSQVEDLDEFTYRRIKYETEKNKALIQELLHVMAGNKFKEEVNQLKKDILKEGIVEEDIWDKYILKEESEKEKLEIDKLEKYIYDKYISDKDKLEADIFKKIFSSHALHEKLGLCDYSECHKSKNTTANPGQI